MRQTENKKLIDKLPKEFTGSSAEIQNKILLTQQKILIDISKSLAIMADCAVAQKKDKSAKND